jgi:thiosulfate/3-mercaptopyruvate sulfurtransferase
MSAYAHPAILVDTQWVAEHLNDSKFRIIEIGYDYNNYTSDHIPGAVGWA